MSQVPSKLLTLVFTDLADSTALKAEHGDVAVGELISRHRDLVTRIAQDNSGRIIDWAGDGCFLTFETPSTAVQFAVALQRHHNKEADLPPVRIGLHMGEVTDKPGPDGTLRVEGLAVDLAARVSGLALPGQVLMSSGVFNSARQRLRSDDFDTDVVWLAHGAYELRGFDEPMELCEVGVEGMSPLTAPTGSDKAHRAVTPKDEETLGWRPAVGQHVPRRENWRLEEQLGEGGFGEVWLAIHEKTKAKRVFKFCFEPERVRGLKREVVLFRLLKESLGDREDIAQILDWEFERSPYFLESEYTEGGDLRDWASKRGGLAEVPIDVRIEIIAQVATALGAAHSVGVLHKDIKPANILISEVSGRDKPRASLTDFGIGLITDPAALAAQGITAAGLTETLVGSSSSDSGSTVGAGTRIYMAPELLEGRPATTRSDLYSLGVVLYQLVIGDLNHSIAAGWERDVEDELLREDIAACIDGNPDLRLSSADELADRLRTIDARRRERKAQRRNQTLRRRFTIASAAGITLTAIFGIFAFQQASRAASERSSRIKEKEARLQAEALQREADEQRARAVQERAQADALRAVAEKRRYISDVQLARFSLERGDMSGAQRTLEGTPEQFRGWEWGYLANAAWPRVSNVDSEDESLSPEVTALERWDNASDSLVVILEGHDGPVTGMEFSPDGKLLTTKSSDGAGYLWSTESWEQVHKLEGLDTYSSNVPFTPDSAYLARNNVGKLVTVHDVRTNEIVARLEYSDDSHMPWAFNVDGSVLLTTASAKVVAFWDWRREELLTEFRMGPVHRNTSRNVQLAIGGFTVVPNHYMIPWEQNSFRVIDVRTGAVVDEIEYQAQPGYVPIKTNSDQSIVFTYNFDEQQGAMHRLDTGEQVGQLPIQIGREQFPATFSPDGSLFAFKTINNQIHLIRRGRESNAPASSDQNLRATIHNVPSFNYGNALAFSPDGRFIAVPGPDGTVRILTPTRAKLGEALLTLDHDDSVYQAHFDPDGRHLVSASYDGYLHRWDTETGTETKSVRAHDAEISRMSMSANGEFIATTAYDGTRTVWTSDLERQVFSFKQPTDSNFAGGPRSVLVRLGSSAAMRTNMHPTKPLALFGDADGGAVVVNIETGETLHRLQGHQNFPYRPEFTRIGARVVTHGYQVPDVKVWDLVSGDLLQTLVGPGQVIHTSTTPDDRYLASTHINGSILLWDLEAEESEPKPVKEFTGHSGAVMTADFHPTKPMMVTASVDQSVRLWDIETGETLHTMTGHAGVVPVARFNTSGTRIVSGSQDDTVRIWDLEGHELATLPVPGSLVTVEWSADERRILATTLEGTVAVWSAAPWSELAAMGDAESPIADRLRVWRGNHVR